MRRRDFLTASLASAAIPYTALAGGKTKSAHDVITLGPAGVKVSRLAMGTGSSGFGGSSNQTRQLGLGGIADLFRFGYDEGVRFWDSADQYGSHPHLKAALRNVPREKVAILTKTHASTEAEMRADLDRFRREIGADYLDIVLLHCMLDQNWPAKKQGAMAVLSEAREKGIVRTHGVSCHTLEALQTAARTPWVQVDLARINPAGLHMDAAPQTVISVLREMKAAGKGVIGMKILGQGDLRNRIDEAIEFALSQDCVDCFTIGAESRQELGDLMRRIPAASSRT